LQAATGLSRSAARRAVARLAAAGVLAVTYGPERGPKSCANVSLQPLISRLVLLRAVTEESLKALRLLSEPQKVLFDQEGRNAHPITSSELDEQRARSEAARERALRRMREFRPPVAKVRVRA
jgi:hypothetical protein